MLNVECVRDRVELPHGGARLSMLQGLPRGENTPEIQQSLTTKQHLLI